MQINLIESATMPSCLEDVMTAVKNLRQQAESEAKQEKKYRKPKPDFISWSEAKSTRERVMALVAEMSTDKKRNRKQSITLLTDALIISMLTIMPPDRVGVIRRLSMKETLKKCPDSENYYIDLERFGHKTAKFYGPSKTLISPLITPILKTYLDATQRFEFTEVDDAEEQNRTQRRYLFPMTSDANRCLESAIGPRE